MASPESFLHWLIILANDGRQFFDNKLINVSALRHYLRISSTIQPRGFNMVKRRDIDRCISTLSTQIEKMRAWGFPAAAVYSTPDGTLKIVGSDCIVQIVRDHQQEIFNHAEFRQEYGDEEAGPENHHTLLPVIDPPLELRNFQSTRSLAVSVVRASCAGMSRKVGWGDPERKPEWWPEGVVWGRRGVQSGVSHNDLKDVIRACYAFHDQELDAGTAGDDEEPDDEVAVAENPVDAPRADLTPAQQPRQPDIPQPRRADPTPGQQPRQPDIPQPRRADLTPAQQPRQPDIPQPPRTDLTPAQQTRQPDIPQLPRPGFWKFVSNHLWTPVGPHQVRLSADRVTQRPGSLAGAGAQTPHGRPRTRPRPQTLFSSDVSPPPEEPLPREERAVPTQREGKRKAREAVEMLRKRQRKATVVFTPSDY